MGSVASFVGYVRSFISRLDFVAPRQTLFKERCSGGIQQYGNSAVVASICIHVAM